MVIKDKDEIIIMLHDEYKDGDERAATIKITILLVNNVNDNFSRRIQIVHNFLLNALINRHVTKFY